VFKLFTGLLKGLVIGAAIGYGAFALQLDGGFHWVTYGAIGALVGLLVGRPIWSLLFDRNSTSVVSILKAVFGFGVGVGLYALINKVLGGGPRFEVPPLAEGARALQDWTPILGGAIGALYGAFVEVDDSVGEGPKSGTAKDAKKLPAAAAPAAKPPAKKS
jgi:hypothetical protein